MGKHIVLNEIDPSSCHKNSIIRVLNGIILDSRVTVYDIDRIHYVAIETIIIYSNVCGIGVADTSNQWRCDSAKTIP